jgi:hypothetical protein
MMSFPKRNMRRVAVGLVLLASLGIAGCSSAPVTPGVELSPTVLATATITMATPTRQPMATPVPTATLTPEPPQQYFTEEFNGSVSYWSFFQFFGDEGDFNPRPEDGFLVFNLQAQNQWTYAVYNPFEYQDVRLDMQAVNRASLQNDVGLVCRYSQENGWYEFNVSNDGKYSFLYGQWLSDGIARYSWLRSGDTDKVKQGSETNEYSFVCRGDTLTGYLNGVQMRSLDVSSIGLKTGQVGLTVSSFDHLPVTVGVDWVEISQP